MPYIMNACRAYSSGRISDVFRSAMSHMSSQAMILTAGIKHRESPEKSILHGMTISSVSSLSVYPKPLMIFNVHLPSYTSTALHECGGMMAIHLLPPSQKSAQLGRIFASGVKQDPRKPSGENPISENSEGDMSGDVFQEMTTPFKFIDQDDWYYHISEDEFVIPIIKEAEKAFICKKHSMLDVDQHEIWVIEVIEILSPNAAWSESKTGGLIYYDRSFHQIGERLEEEIQG